MHLTPSNSRSAMKDPLWRAMQDHEDIPYRVYGLDERVYSAWTRMPEQESRADLEQTGFLHADRILKMHDMVMQKPLIREDNMVSLGRTVAQHDSVFRKAFQESQHRKNKGNRKKSKHNDELTTESLMADSFAKKASAADTLKEMQTELDATMARLQKEDDDDNGSPSTPQVGSPSKRPSVLVASSPLTKMRIGSSASAKLNYIINEVNPPNPAILIVLITTLIFRSRNILLQRSFLYFRSHRYHWPTLQKHWNSYKSSFCGLRLKSLLRFENSWC